MKLPTFAEFIGTSVVVVLFITLVAVSAAITWRAFSWAFGL